MKRLFPEDAGFEIVRKHILACRGRALLFRRLSLSSTLELLNNLFAEGFRRQLRSETGI